MQAPLDHIEIYREQLNRILNSPEFSGSRQAFDFLSYVSGAAFQNRSHVDQAEIAEHVLHCNGDFNPVDDTSVRKLASVTRHKLERYYRAQGVHDPILVTLAHRLYIPHFQFRDSPPTEHLGQVPERRPEEASPVPGTSRVSATVAAAVAILGTMGFWMFQKRSEAMPARFHLVTKAGDIVDRAISLPPEGIKVGMEVAPDEDIMGRMVFTPEGANQHAGLMIYGGLDLFVKFGRRLWSRASSEFGIQVHGLYAKPPGTFSYDPKGQDGSPVWLSIRRQGTSFQAFSGTDGEIWSPLGSTLTVPDPIPSARFAVYAMQEAMGETEASAEFDQLGAGLLFHHRPDGPFDSSEFKTWQSDTECPGSQGFRIHDGALEIAFSQRQAKCPWDLMRPAPPGDWAFSAKMDLLSFDGTGAGIAARGQKKRFRIIRWSAGGGSVSAQTSPGAIVSKPDFKGSPPLWLRMECHRGVLSGSFSRDNNTFTRIPMDVPLSELGSDVRVGIHASSMSWTSSEVLPVARFYYIRQDVLSLRNFR
jgi:hypothetical protein